MRAQIKCYGHIKQTKILSFVLKAAAHEHLCKLGQLYCTVDPTIMWTTILPRFLLLQWHSIQVTIEHVARSISSAMGFKGELVFDTTRPDGELKRTASNSKMRMYLPNFKFTPFDDAIKETVEWFKATYPNVRK